MADLPDGSGRYVRVLHSSLGHPKFLGLSAAERGTWVTALVLADINHPGPVHEGAVLEKCPDAAFERLYERQLLEQDGRPGWFRVHDLKQFHVAPSSTPEAAAERKRRQRERERESQMSQPSRKSRGSRESRQTRRDETRRDSTGEKGVVQDGDRADGSRPPEVRGFKRAIE